MDNCLNNFRVVTSQKSNLVPAEFDKNLNQMLNQIVKMAFYSCFEEQNGQFGILALVGKAQHSPECQLIKLSAGYCRPTPTSIMATWNNTYF